MKQIIKGLIYYNSNSKCLLRPHFSGDYSSVQCDRYLTKKQLKENGLTQFADKNDVLTYEDKKYFRCESNVYETEYMELLSDVSKIEFFDEQTNF